MKAHLILAALCAGPGLALAEDSHAWEKSPGIPMESELLSDCLDAAQNHFLTDGMHGFVAGRSFYQAVGELSPFIWPTHPFARLWPDREWLDDSATLSFQGRLGGPGNAPLDGGAPGFSSGAVEWQALSEVRLRAALDENGLYLDRARAAREAMAGPKNRDRMDWLGGRVPSQSRLGAGGEWSHRGADIAAQYDQGYWWTVSPVSGVAYPWEGFNADFLYRAGQDVDISLRDQEWDAAAADSFHSSRWRRSEVNLGFNAEGSGGWMTRLELGYQRRALFSDSAFKPFEEKTYPVRFRYRQTWAPFDSAFKLTSRGSFAYREQMLLLEHAEEFQEQWERHEPSQYLRGYYREPVGSHPNPTEYLENPITSARGDSARYVAGNHARGIAGGAEYRYRFGAEATRGFTLGVAADAALEWSAPVFRLSSLDTVDGLIRRGGAYAGGDYPLANGSGRVFAAGGWRSDSGSEATWRLHGGLRAFAGHYADSMEYLPSPWWAGGDGGWKFPFGTRLAAGVYWLGPKEVRGWGPVFKVPAHFENNFAVEQPLFKDRMKLSVSLLQVFGREVREHPNGSPLGFRILGRAEGNF